MKRAINNKKAKVSTGFGNSSGLDAIPGLVVTPMEGLKIA
jgi:hypothetical protein